jgi:hypothetical protein
MATLTPELREEIEKARGNPVRLEDPETHTAYVLLKAEEYDRLNLSGRSESVPTDQVPEAVRRSKEAFLRELPRLMARKRLRGRWVIYCGQVRIGVSRRGDELLRKAHKLGLRNDQFYFGVVEPHSPEPEEIEHSFFEFDDVESVS